MIPSTSVMSDDLKAKLESFRGYVLSPEEREAQRQSFVRAFSQGCAHGVLDYESCPKCGVYGSEREGWD